MTKMAAQEKKFPMMLKTIMTKYGLKNVQLAASLNVTSQYISKLQNGTNLPSREQMTNILQFLEGRNVPVAEQRVLTSYFVEDKTGFFYEIADLEFAARKPLEKKLLMDFRMLEVDAQKKILSYVNELLINSL